MCILCIYIYIYIYVGRRLRSRARLSPPRPPLDPAGPGTGQRWAAALVMIIYYTGNTTSPITN